jgi:hypothetical protein
MAYCKNIIAASNGCENITCTAVTSSIQPPCSRSAAIVTTSAPSVYHEGKGTKSGDEHKRLSPSGQDVAEVAEQVGVKELAQGKARDARFA